MKFHLSPDQEALQDTIQRTVERVCPPEKRRERLEAETDYEPQLWAALMEAGVGGLLIPEAYGGLEFGLENTALAFETLGKTATPGPYLGHVLAGWAIAQGDDQALKDQWLPRLAAGEAVAALALEDWTADSWTVVVADGRLSGEFGFVPGADQAQVFVVGVAGGLAVVERGDGVTVSPVPSSDLTRKLWKVSLDKAPAKVIAPEAVAARLIDAGLVLVAADAAGGATQALSMAVEYAKVREQFGTIIGRFQALKHQLANMALEVEPCRALVWYAAYAWDLALPDSARVAAHAKAHVADRYTSVTRGTVQAHGGIGYTWEYDLHLYFRRALFDRAFLGNPSLHRERVAVMAGW